MTAIVANFVHLGLKLSQQVSSTAAPTASREIVKNTTTTSTSTITHGDGFKIFVELISNLAWPAIAGLVIILIFKNLDALSRLLAKAPIIRRFSVAGVEIELDRRELDQLKENTEATFRELIRKTNSELGRFRDALPIQAALEAAASAILKAKFGTGAPPDEANIRCAIHVPDVVFQEFLYQLTNYIAPKPSKAATGGSGRRFSIRYGIIGLSWRTKSSRGIGDAFQGNPQEIEALIERWSMLDPEADHGKHHPSCLAIIARDSQYKKSVGIIYLDGTKADIFGNEIEATKFAEKCEKLEEVRKLADLLLDFDRMSSQVKILFDLSQIDGK